MEGTIATPSSPTIPPAILESDEIPQISEPMSEAAEAPDTTLKPSNDTSGEGTESSETESGEAQPPKKKSKSKPKTPKSSASGDKPSSPPVKRVPGGRPFSKLPQKTLENRMHKLKVRIDRTKSIFDKATGYYQKYEREMKFRNEEAKAILKEEAKDDKEASGVKDDKEASEASEAMDLENSGAPVKQEDEKK